MEWTAQQGVDSRGDRVREHTAPVVNRRIDRATEAAVERCTREGREAVVRRLGELEREWDIDRALIVLFPIAAGVTSALAIRRLARRRLFQARRRNPFLPMFRAQLAALLLHGVVGWCPPASVLRRLGFRTRPEIDSERFALLRFLETSRAAA
jgi:hypothetical protein